MSNGPSFSNTIRAIQLLKWRGRVILATERAVALRSVIRNMGEDTYRLIKQAAREAKDESSMHLPIEQSLFELLMLGPPETIERFTPHYHIAVTGPCIEDPSQPLGMGTKCKTHNEYHCVTCAPKCKTHGNPWYCGHCGKVEPE